MKRGVVEEAMHLAVVKEILGLTLALSLLDFSRMQAHMLMDGCWYLYVLLTVVWQMIVAYSLGVEKI